MSSVLYPEAEGYGLLLDYGLLTVLCYGGREDVNGAMIRILLRFIRAGLIEATYGREGPITNGFPSILGMTDFDRLLDVRVDGLCNDAVTRDCILGVICNATAGLARTVLDLDRITAETDYALDVPRGGLEMTSRIIAAIIGRAAPIEDRMVMDLARRITILI